MPRLMVYPSRMGLPGGLGGRGAWGGGGCVEDEIFFPRPIKMTMSELVKLPLHTCPVTVQCAGNRRKEQNLIKKGMGFDWGSSAVSTNIWTGVLIRTEFENLNHLQTLKGSISIVTKPNFASKHSFESSSCDLQDLHASFARKELNFKMAKMT